LNLATNFSQSRGPNGELILVWGNAKSTILTDLPAWAVSPLTESSSGFDSQAKVETEVMRVFDEATSAFTLACTLSGRDTDTDFVIGLSIITAALALARAKDMALKDATDEVNKMLRMGGRRWWQFWKRNM
jgi:hypothetical protein